MKYTIEWCEKKTTSTGKQKLDATLKDESGASYDNVTIWGDFPNFSELAPGFTVEGEVVEKQNGQYLNKTLYAPKAPKAVGSTFKQKMIEDTMAKKEESIRRIQTDKEENIKLMSAQRDAVLLVTTFYTDVAEATPFPDRETFIKAKVVEFRDWLLSAKFQEHTPF